MADETNPETAEVVTPETPTPETPTLTDEEKDKANGEIYKLLAKENPSEEDITKIKELMGQAAWKDGIPDDFMAKVFPEVPNSQKLGEYKNGHIVANVVKNLKQVDDNLVGKFVNADNLPNKETPANYLARHAVALEEKIGKGNWSENGQDQIAMGGWLKGQKEALQALVDNGADLTKVSQAVLDADGNEVRPAQNFTDVAKTTDGKASVYLKDFIEQAKQQEDTKRNNLLIEEAKKQLNIDGEAQKKKDNVKLQETAEKKKEEKVANVSRDNGQESTGGSDYQGPKIVEKDIIDYLYNDIFIYYLNKMTDAMIGYITGKAKQLEEFSARHAKEADKAAENVKDDNLKAGMKKVSHMFTTDAPALSAAYGAGLKRSRDMNADLLENIKNHPHEPEKWTWPKSQMNPLNKEDMQQIAALKQKYKDNPDSVKKCAEALDKDGGKLFAQHEAMQKMAVQAAMIKYAQQKMLEGDTKWIDKEVNFAKDKEFQKMVSDELHTIETGYATSLMMAHDYCDSHPVQPPLTDEAYRTKTQEDYQQGFLDSYGNRVMAAQAALFEDVKAGRFGFNKQLSKDERKLTASPHIEAMVADAKSVEEMAKVYGKTDNMGKFTSLYEAGKPRQEGVLADMQRWAAMIDGAQQKNSQRRDAFNKQVKSFDDVEKSSFFTNFVQQSRGRS